MFRTTTPHRSTTRRAITALVAALLTVTCAVATPTGAAAAAAAYEGYLFAYFTGEGTADGEQVHFAVSRGNDPLRYDVLNGGRPALVSTVGTKGVRDPFVMRKQDGTFVLVATDLRMYRGPSWDQVQRTGSRSIVVWESADLVTWSAPRAVVVADSTAGNVWAPEAYYDPALGKYVVFWASKLYAASDPDHTASTYNRMLYATTTDFRTFSAPKVWVDPGYSVIDSTVIGHDGTYHRFTKDERSSSTGSPCGKFVLQERATSLTSTSYSPVAECIGKGVIGQGEGPLIFKSNTENRWYLFVDEFTGRGYVPFESTDLASGRWTEVTGAQLPASPRHGAVVPITKAELDRVAGARTAVPVTAGKRTVRAMTSGFTTSVWRHGDFAGRIDPISASSPLPDRQDATFAVVPGLADPSCSSFESVNFPGRFLRQADLRLRLDARATTASHRADATFCAQAGNSGSGVTWRSYAVPTRVVRHYGQVLYLAANGGPNAFDSTGNWAADTTWRDEAPLAP
ncbi:glycoside hydrolase family 43 protein [Umezawaea beigongshangensis]|uniref:glycoside hydrolase family 43 protein n=1 Tax=Umezawaea beigongshangensis TaxID=2780383 RepID=UPI0018F2328B|nr:glycoside hydrolase family 43 protein [Umezawaea beigongshangensis]